ncbi:hypothetical protein MNBD_IGNAVI01-540, partial [hydrothermal vent metagenome]
KYKGYINNNRSIGITGLSLTIPAFISDFTNKDEVIKAMQNTKTMDVEKWRNQNIGKSLLKRRLEVFKKVG